MDALRFAHLPPAPLEAAGPLRLGAGGRGPEGDPHPPSPGAVHPSGEPSATIRGSGVVSALEGFGPSVGSTLVYGACRPLVNLLLFAAAKAADPAFQWLDVRAATERAPVVDPVSLGWIEDHHHWRMEPSEASHLDHARANAALFELVRDDEPPQMLSRLAEFLRLPAGVQRMLVEGSADDRPAILAVANADRTAEAVPSEALPPILDALSWAGYSLFVGYCGPAPAARSRFGTVLRLDGDSVDRWADARLTVESAPGRGVLGPSPPVRLADMPFAAHVLRQISEQ